MLVRRKLFRNIAIRESNCANDLILVEDSNRGSRVPETSNILAITGSIFWSRSIMLSILLIPDSMV